MISWTPTVGRLGVFFLPQRGNGSGQLPQNRKAPHRESFVFDPVTRTGHTSVPQIGWGEGAKLRWTWEGAKLYSPLDLVLATGRSFRALLEAKARASFYGREGAVGPCEIATKSLTFQSCFTPLSLVPSPVDLPVAS